ncbi:MAG: arsenite methyltransferase [Candidatus Aenigmatarchaeota archaeon]
MKSMQKKEIKKIVRKSYGKIAESGCSCGCGQMNSRQLSKQLGYSEKETNLVPEANLGLGCGNPTAIGEIRKGMTVLDLGSGAGFDCFLAAGKVGKSGRVIGVDMTEQMIAKARKNAKKYGFSNVEFRLGDIEKLPVENESVDVIISNCVINLAPDKRKVFGEAHRVLRKDGMIYVSDIVLLQPLSASQKDDEKLIAGCVGGAILKEKYLKIVMNAGFEIRMLSDDKKISKLQYNNIPVESLKIAAVKK